MMKNRSSIILIVVFFLMACFSACTAQEIEIPKEDLVRVYFVGYEENDLVFHIVNDLRAEIEIIGLAFQRYVLYRPVEKGICVEPATEERSYTEVIFRTTGDFVWSENHMSKFKLTYTQPGLDAKQYVDLVLAETVSEE